jgi:hypothetical protein
MPCSKAIDECHVRKLTFSQNLHNGPDYQTPFFQCKAKRLKDSEGLWLSLDYGYRPPLFLTIVRALTNYNPFCIEKCTLDCPKNSTPPPPLIKFPLKFWTPLFWFPTLVCWSPYLSPPPQPPKKNILSWIWNLGWFWVYSDDLVMFISSRYEIRVCKLRSWTFPIFSTIVKTINIFNFQWWISHMWLPPLSYHLKLGFDVPTTLSNWQLKNYNEVQNWVSWWHGLISVFKWRWWCKTSDQAKWVRYSLVWYGNMIGFRSR